ncbi:MAG: hypothetical protein U9P49_05495 [Thermodesulfobacteriota bacterium]|nr:hypothetical protein [Thermodesulfobacteriota bacterium]
MHNTELKLAEINKDLALLPESRLDEVKNFIAFILSQTKDKRRKIVQMRGVWKGKGFERLDIDKEIKAVRQEMSESIRKRKV